jgi:hypothetical protein
MVNYIRYHTLVLNPSFLHNIGVFQSLRP